ncbi:hypothetical protein NL64_06400 [Pseudomonas fluorescens]|uniref:hypothetical protein n=1 Tax=Pseudomonas fluorescens TaxID=294 RepID=UPI00054B4E96|nr:hypothetical protein [Pseudomonas fluorescens]KII34886.1 hypothetical protein NL64_06400 [Pseudomonas fluorescens]
MKILGEDYLLVTLDFESYYGTGCTLTSLNTFQYLNHPEFTIHGVGVQLDDGPRQWFRDTADAIAYIEDEACDTLIALLCQNTQFDGMILHHFYDWHPDLYLDTQCMSKGLFPTESASLEKLCERLWPNDLSMRKGKELVQFRNVTTQQLYASEAMLAAMIKYCIGNDKKDQGDVGLTYEAFLRMEPHYPDDELRLIDLHIRMMCNPIFTLNKDLVQECYDEGVEKRNALLKAAGVATTTLSSDTKFAAYVRDKLGITLPMKPSPTVKIKVLDAEGRETGEEVPKMIPALGKADMGFQEMRAHHKEHEHIWAGRVAAKSTGEITRAERFLETADQCHGMMPVCLNYYGAHTGRSSGTEKLNQQNLRRGSKLRRSLSVRTRQVAV